MPAHTEHRGFFKLYDRLTNKLVSPVAMLPITATDKKLRTIPVKISALWDTGATMSCIKPELINQFKMSLLPDNYSITASGIGGSVRTDATVISIYLTENLIIEGCPVYITDFPGDTDLIIGMDIIGMGDFAVCNVDGKTSFSFAVPPFSDRVNFAVKADASNRDSSL
jgi:hypothetical protein